jgi:hypothetical protein
VNANFSSLKTAIDDNDMRLNELEAESDITSEIIGTWAAKSFNNGFEGELGSITFHSNGSFTINEGTLSVLRGCNIQECSSLGGTWEVINNTVIAMQLDGVDSMTNGPNKRSFPFVATIMSNKISLLRSFNFTLLIRE